MHYMQLMKDKNNSEKNSIRYMTFRGQGHVFINFFLTWGQGRTNFIH